MARYSDDREHNREVKYLYKIWAKVDSRIELPPVLTGKALLPLLENIPAPRPAGEERSQQRRIWLNPHAFSWKSGMTYAAALVLIVALASMMGRGGGEIVGGSIEPASEAPVPFQVSEDAAAPRAAASEPPQAFGEGLPASAKPEPLKLAEPEPGEDAGASADPSHPAEAPAVGGQSESVLLGEYGGYTCTWRHNDATDPDKLGYPITVNMADTATGELAFAIDIAGMETVEGAYLFEGTLALLGTAADQGGVLLQCYDIADADAPQEVLALRQEGALLEARLYKNVLDVFTFAPDGTEPGCEVTRLPESTEDDLCIVSAVDLQSLVMEQRAFAGAGRDLSVYNLNAYLEYEGEITEENEEGRYVAHIRLNGMEIDLRADQEP